MTSMTMRTTRGRDGAVVHVPTPIAAKPAGGRQRKARVVPDPIKTNGETAAEELRLLVERLECIAGEVKDAQDDFTEVIDEVKSRGYSDKAIRSILAIRKKDRETLQEEETVLDLYRQHLGLAS